MEKFKKLFIVPFILIIVAISNSACKKCCYDPANPECESYDPCYNRTNADFEISISNTCKSWEDTKEIVYEGDIIPYLNELELTPLHEADSFYWQLGTDPIIHREKVLNINFGNAAGKIDIRLTTFRKNTNSECAIDTGYSTVTKTVFIKERFEAAMIGNSYQGSFSDSPNDLFVIKFITTLDTITPSYITNDYYIENYPPECSGIASSLVEGYGVRNFCFIGPETQIVPCGFNYATGTGYFRYVRFNRDFSEIDIYSLKGGTSELQKLYFHEKKIN